LHDSRLSAKENLKHDQKSEKRNVQKGYLLDLLIPQLIPKQGHSRNGLLMLMLMLMLVIMTSFHSVNACTDIIVMLGASIDGSAMIAYSRRNYVSRL
jgi:hypothetical protein